MFRFALFHAVDSIIICIMNVCLKKPVQLPFENRLAFQANTHTHTDRHTARRTRNRNETYFKLVLIFMHKQYYVYAPDHAPLPCSSSPSPATTTNMVN